MGRHTSQPEDKVDRLYEHRLRRMAKRQGFILLKSRRCDPLVLNCGPYSLIHVGQQKIDFGLTLEQVEQKISFGLTLEQVEQIVNGSQSKPGENA